MATEVGQATIKLTFDTKSLSASQTEAAGVIESAGDQMGAVWAAKMTVISEAVKKAMDGVISLGKQVFQIGMDFEAQMSRVSAISGATGGELAKLSDKAKQMGESTIFSATESAQAFEYMAMAGWKTEDMLDGIEGIMNLAAASGENLATVSDIVTDALTAMGYSAKDAGKFADVMAAASSNANTNVSLMGETFKYAASVAGAMGYSMEDVSVAIGLMANSGIKGAQAGTSLRSILTNLASPTTAMSKAMEKLGVSVKDETGQMRSLDDVMTQLRKGFSKLDEAQKAEYASTIAGKYGMSGLLAVVNATEEDFNKLTRAVQGSAGAAQDMADTMNDNLKGALTIIGSQWESAMNSVYESIVNTLGQDKINSIVEGVISAIQGFGQAVADVAAFIVGHGEEIIAVLGAIATAVAIAFVADKIIAFVSMLTGPLGIVIALGAAVAAIGLFMMANDDANSSMSETEKFIRETNAALAEQKDRWKEIQEKRQTYLDEGLSEIAYYQSLATELEHITDENGVVQEGYERRAEFIVSTLNEALGMEIEYNNGVINSYNNVKTAIEELLEQKKAKIILDSQEEAYTEAIKQQEAAMTALADAGRKKAEVDSELWGLEWELSQNRSEMTKEQIKESQEKVASLRKDQEELNKTYENAQEQYKEYTYAIQQYEDNLALFHEGKYNEMSTATWEYVSQFQDAEDAQKAMLEDQLTTTTSALANLRVLYSDTGNEIYAREIDNYQSRYNSLKEQLQAYNSATGEGMNNVVSTTQDGIASQTQAIEDSKTEFQEQGEATMQAYKEGMVNKSPEVVQAAVDTTVEMCSKVQSKKPDAVVAGEAVLDGIGNGVRSQSKQSSILSSVTSFASSVVSKFKSVLGINSPSKITTEFGEYLLQGFGIGMENEEDTLLGQASNLGNAITGTLAGSIGLPSTLPTTTAMVDYSSEFSILNEAEEVADEEGEMAPLVVNLNLDGEQIEQVILQDTRRAV